MEQSTQSFVWTQVGGFSFEEDTPDGPEIVIGQRHIHQARHVGAEHAVSRQCAYVHAQRPVAQGGQVLCHGVAGYVARP